MIPWPGPIRLWLFRVPGFAAADPRLGRTFWRVLGAAVGWSAVVYLVGLAWSVVLDFPPYRLSAAPVQVAALLAVMWIDVYWVAVTLPLKLAPAAEAIQGGESAVRDVRRRLDRWGGSWRLPAVGVLLMTVCVVAFGLWPREGTLLIGQVFEDAWLAEPRLPKIILGVIWAVPVGSILITGIAGLVLFWNAIGVLAARRLIERPAFVLPRLRSPVMFAHYTALAWSSPLVIFFVMTFGKQGLISPWFVLIATAMGLFTLFQPHVAFHFALQRLEATLSASLRNEVDLALDSPGLTAADRVEVLAQAMVEPPITWLYDLRVLVSLSLGPLVPAAIGYLGLR